MCSISTLLSSASQLFLACCSRIGWLEQEVSAHISHVTALRGELQDVCLRDNLAFVPRRDMRMTADTEEVALAKLHLQAQFPSSCGPVEVALPGLVFDLSSLVLYGAQAVPVRLKILLDRLYSVVTTEQVGHILHTLGWSLGDYVRGYMLQHHVGKVLDRWLMVNPEEELLILKQFLRFGETRPIVELMTLQCLAADPELNHTSKSFHSHITTHSERNGGVMRNTRGDELFPPSKLTQCLRRLSGTKLAESYRQEGGRREQENDRIVQKSKVDPVLKIKADPDKPNPTKSSWHQDPRPPRFLPPSMLFTPRLPHLVISPSPSAPSLLFHLQEVFQVQNQSNCCVKPVSLHQINKTTISFCRCAGTLKIHYNAVHLKIKHRCTKPKLLTNRQRRCESGDPVPKKKKPRKSSMPVKIEREKVEGVAADSPPGGTSSETSTSTTEEPFHFDAEPCTPLAESTICTTPAPLREAKHTQHSKASGEAQDSQEEEILAAVDRIIAEYEDEVSGFRQQISRQKIQLELLQDHTEGRSSPMNSCESDTTHIERWTLEHCHGLSQASIIGRGGWRLDGCFVLLHLELLLSAFLVV
ncbi:hypothetical protein F7725_005019 [Dissostichus mawsoni]|uniref:Uncharacterized protein n=1 Tax=Dissostichus mawsoni TaxID=36200 RepID=A0A7J5XKD7_DISMA|nr:hypothetical protein F7725_005019 [Dissostichus mawsoni]